MRPTPVRSAVALTVVILVLTAGLAGGTIQPPSASGDPATDTESTVMNTTAASHPDSVVQPPNTTSYLRVPESRLESYGTATATVDVPGATSIDGDRLQVRLAVETFEHEFDQAVTSRNRTRTVQSVLRRFEGIVERARDRQQTALQRYSDGEISDQELIRTIARVDATARAIQTPNTADDALGRVRSLADSPLDYSLGGGLTTRIENMEARLVTLRGQLRQEMHDAVRGGNRAGMQVYIETGENDLVLATILNNLYLRDSYIGPAFNPTNQLDEGQALSRLQDLYVWGFKRENYVSFPETSPIGNTSVYTGSTNHNQGRLDAYLDMNTNDAFRESQVKSLSEAAPITPITVTNGSVTVRVNGTHETGPMELTATRNTTNTTLDGTVYVDDIRVGTTGDDGKLWFVDTRGDTEIRVETAQGNVTMFVFDGRLPG